MFAIDLPVSISRSLPKIILFDDSFSLGAEFVLSSVFTPKSYGFFSSLSFKPALSFPVLQLLSGQSTCATSLNYCSSFWTLPKIFIPPSSPTKAFGILLLLLEEGRVAGFFYLRPYCSFLSFPGQVPNPFAVLELAHFLILPKIRSRLANL